MGFFLGIVVCCLSGSEFIRSVFKGLASLYKQQRMMKRSKSNDLAMVLVVCSDWNGYW